MKELTILLPVFNEIEIIDDCFDAVNELIKIINYRIKDLSIKILFVDNYSTDGTWQKLENKLRNEKEWQAVRLVRNYGVQASLLRGMSITKSDGLLVFQSDLQDPKEVASNLVELWFNGARVVVGITTQRSENALDRFSRNIFYKILKNSSDFNLKAWLHDFYVLDYQVYSQLFINGYQHEFIRGRITEEFGIDKYVNYSRLPRSKGHSSFNYARKHSMALDGVLRFGGKIARFISLFAIATSLFNIFIILFLISAWVYGSRSPIQGWLSLFSLGLAILSAITLLIAIVLEFQFRILRLSQNSVAPFIVEKINFDLKPNRDDK
jgi:dolichol-phosphate mannosyltransferase